MFAEGRIAVQVQRWLGHHSAAFALSAYVHLLGGDIREPVTLTGATSLVSLGFLEAPARPAAAAPGLAGLALART
jgi:hypothetical protein